MSETLFFYPMLLFNSSHIILKEFTLFQVTFYFSCSIFLLPYFRFLELFFIKWDHDYSQEGPTLQEITPGHFVSCNTEELKRYQSELK